MHYYRSVFLLLQFQRQRKHDGMRRAIYAMMMVMLVTTARAEVVLEFGDMPEGPVSIIEDATFSLAGSGAEGDPYIKHEPFGSGLWNSTDGGYGSSTNTILRVDFDTPVNDVSFVYNPQGLGGEQGWAAFDGEYNILESHSFLSGSSNGYDAGNDIAAIEWNSGVEGWASNLESLTYARRPSVVPESSSYLFLFLGLCVGVAMVVRRGRRATN